MSSRSTALARIALSNISQRARPRSLARYIAASASRISVSGSTSTSSGTGDPDAHPDEHLGVVDDEPAADRPVDPLGHRDRVALVEDVLAQHDELVTAEAGDRVARAQRQRQALADGDEQAVAQTVARGCR